MENLKKFRKNDFDVNVADFTFAQEIWDWQNFNSIYNKADFDTPELREELNKIRNEVFQRMIEKYPNLYTESNNEFIKTVISDDAIDVMTNGGTQCVACNAHIKYKMPFHNTGDNGYTEFVALGQDCAYILDQKTDFEALAIRQKEAEELAKKKAEWAMNKDNFKAEYPALYQAAEYFSQDNYNHIIVDIFSKIKWGLSEKQIAFLEKLCLQAWANEVARNWQLMTKVVPHTAGMQTVPVTITRYYVNDSGFTKTLFHTEGNSKIFTGKTQQLASSKVWYNFFYQDEEQEELEMIWSNDTTKANRKKYFDFEYYPQGTKGLLTIDLNVADNDDTVGFGKIINFVPTSFPA